MNINPKYIIVVLLVIMLAATLLFVKVIRSEQTQCINNPYFYGAGRIEKAANSTLTCTCSFTDGKYKPIYWGSKGSFQPEVVDAETSKAKIYNWSGIDFTPYE